MPAFWFSLKRSLQCKSQPSDVHNPRARNNLGNIIQTKKPCGFICSRSVSNLRDVFSGSKRHTDKLPVSFSPRSLGSSDFLNPITHEVVLSDSTCEFKITGFSSDGDRGGEKGVSSTFVGTLKPGTPGPGGQEMAYRPEYYPATARRSLSVSRKIHGDSPVFGASNFKPRNSLDVSKSGDSLSLNCKKCYEKFKTLDAVEEHHLSKHAVTELTEGDSSRKIVEIICRANWLKSEANFVNIEKIFKIHNMQTKIAQFEEYRELVKRKASNLATRHSRCLADGNELLRFHGTTVSCCLGMNGSSCCTLETCGVCRILRHGFSNNDMIFTASTSGRALGSIEITSCARKVLLVCRVIAGRVCKPLENFQEFSGFDSLAGKIGQHSNIEELYVVNCKALLPCFVVIY
ncbi:uncharacterized protein LOC126677183 [Mercurialis annua]|uniref:uncharacterized protein LOC126677183 n=1 Tax=Mercurialis annua TaxID=3986 RepID=UPI00215EADAA|nr:uncharacterized protein LOC126677183 [Mercurialis annua]